MDYKRQIIWVYCLDLWNEENFKLNYSLSNKVISAALKYVRFEKQNSISFLC